MELVPVSGSSQIKAVYYDNLKHKLFVQFHSGGSYWYTDVPPSTYDELMDAESMGSYFNKNIRNKYTYKKVGNPQQEMGA